MKWGAELWDGFDKCSKYFHDGIEMCEKYEEFLKERCAIEQSYAKSIKKLVKKFENRIVILENEKQSHLKYLSVSLNETKLIAEQHEQMSTNIQKEVLSKLSGLVRSLKEERKKCIDEKQKLTEQLEKSEDVLKKSKLRYRMAYKDLEKSKETLEKLERDVKTSDINTRKQQEVCEHKYKLCGSFRSEYARQLQETNNLKFEYFEEKLPNLFDSLKKLEEIRIKNFKIFILDCVNIECEMLPYIKNCLMKVEDTSHIVSIHDDVEQMVKIYKDDLKWNHRYQDLREQSIITSQVAHANDDEDEQQQQEIVRDDTKRIRAKSSNINFTLNRSKRAQSTMSTPKYPTIRFIRNIKTFDRIKSALISKKEFEPTEHSNRELDHLESDTMHRVSNKEINDQNDRQQQRYVLFKYFEFKVKKKQTGRKSNS